MINIQAGGFYNYNYQAIIITLFLRLQSKSNAHELIITFYTLAIVTTERPSSVVRRPSSVVRPLTFHILINSSEATGPI
jgi:hypothetical protein